MFRFHIREAWQDVALWTCRFHPATPSFETENSTGKTPRKLTWTMDIKDQHKLKELPFPRPFFFGIHVRFPRSTLPKNYDDNRKSPFISRSYIVHACFSIVIFDFLGECKPKNHPHGQTRMILFFYGLLRFLIFLISLHMWPEISASGCLGFYLLSGFPCRPVGKWKNASPAYNWGTIT